MSHLTSRLFLVLHAKMELLSPLNEQETNQSREPILEHNFFSIQEVSSIPLSSEYQNEIFQICNIAGEGIARMQIDKVKRYQSLNCSVLYLSGKIERSAKEEFDLIVEKFRADNNYEGKTIVEKWIERDPFQGDWSPMKYAQSIILNLKIDEMVVGLRKMAR